MASRKSAVALTVLVAALGFGGCGDDDDDAGGASAAELKERLVPAEQVELEEEREFEWDNATDFVVQGLYFGELTPPSEYIGAIDDAGFEAAAGEVLTSPDHSVRAIVDVASFDSEDGATEARDAVHSEDLKQPCYAECTVTPTEYEVDIPDSVGVHHVPNEGVSPELGGVEAYHVAFTIGSDLYAVQASGPPGGVSEKEFVDGVNEVYEYATAHD